MEFFENNLQSYYKIRINKVFQYIDKNLDSELSLSILAEIASFSPFHFHRIFKLITGETVNEYATRRRIEKSALDLIHKNSSITEVSAKYGFNDNSSFTRAFKKFYGSSPTTFRKQNPNKFSKIHQLESKNGQANLNIEKYICVIENLKNWIKMNAKIEVKEISTMNLAYVWTLGPQNIEASYEKLIQWARPNGLLNDQTKMVTIYHDSFKVTEEHKVRMNACIILNKPVEPEGEIELTTIEKGKYIVGSFEIGLHEFEKSWTGLFIWLNENGYKKADKNPFEIYHNNFNEHPQRKCIVDFCIPIL